MTAHGYDVLPTEPWDNNGDRQAGDTSWARIDLSGVLDGSWKRPVPSMMLRTDGHGLLYPGHTHTFQGEPESGKSFLIQAEAARLLAAGGTVLYLDFESDQGTVVGRMLDLGTDKDSIRRGLDYRRPMARPDSAGGFNMAEWNALLESPVDLIVFDGVTQAYGVWGVDSMDNDGVAHWGRNVPIMLAEATGAAVVCIDHVTKSAEGRGRFGIGAQAKLAYLTGASYTVDVVEPMGIGMRGVLSVRVGKDRPGAVRPVSGEWAKDRTQEAARAVFDSDDDASVTYMLEPPAASTAATGDQRVTVRPTTLMEKVSRQFEMTPNGTLTAKKVRQLVPGKNAYIDQAVRLLVQEGYIEDSTPRRFKRPYRVADDPIR